MRKKISRLLGIILITTNLIYFIPWTIEIVKSGGGSWGLGLLLLPITIATHILLVPATLTWINNDEKQNGFMLTNLLGTIWTLFWLTFFLTTPK